MTESEYAIFLNGGFGVGKSSTLDHIGHQLAKQEQPFSLMDVDWFHRSWPPAIPDNAQIEARNISAVWKCYQSAGPRQLVMCGVIGSEADRERYALAVDRSIRMVRLTADDETTRRRLRGRYHASQQAALDWHLEHYAETAARIETANLEELVVDTSALGPQEVAERILRHFGLLKHLA